MPSLSGGLEPQGWEPGLCLAALASCWQAVGHTPAPRQGSEHGGHRGQSRCLAAPINGVRPFPTFLEEPSPCRPMERTGCCRAGGRLLPWPSGLSSYVRPTWLQPWGWV